VLAATVFKSVGLQAADADLSLELDEQALKDAANKMLGNSQTIFFLFTDIFSFSLLSADEGFELIKPTYPRLSDAICNRPGLHPEHPTAEEGCRSVSRGYELRLMT
jgi:hypothetical protein